MKPTVCTLLSDQDILSYGRTRLAGDTKGILSITALGVSQDSLDSGRLYVAAFELGNQEVALLPLTEVKSENKTIAVVTPLTFMISGLATNSKGQVWCKSQDGIYLLKQGKPIAVSQLNQIGEVGGIMFDSKDRLIFSYPDRHEIYRVHLSADGEKVERMEMLYGNGSRASYEDVDSPIDIPKFCRPKAIAIDVNDDIYFVDRLGDYIRRIQTNGIVNTVADLSSESDNHPKWFYHRSLTIDRVNRMLYVSKRDGFIRISLATASDNIAYLCTSRIELSPDLHYLNNIIAIGPGLIAAVDTTCRKVVTIYLPSHSNAIDDIHKSSNSLSRFPPGLISMIADFLILP
jgi:hypothetical protein